ncbi:YaiO family outer membrane beta-barrel protein [Robertkochia aurantiaca]|uniref:YaiO family outer membrane beta-barrel protein n=1 Tax=Robertkochia aurantiaca TaxID=2873700 RepID=UPI001CC9C4CD|nr:YaiO family outer membrane beta-barrel protein [Robertkochia sp. 3YJGBD-33]
MKKFNPILSLLFFVISLTVTAQDHASPERLYEDARNAAFQQKDYKTAIDLALTALDIQPDYPELQLFLGRLYRWNEQPEKARAVFEDLVSSHPQYQEGVRAYSRLELEERNYIKALTLIEKGRINDPENRETAILQAQILEQMEKHQQAFRLSDSLLREFPDNKEIARMQERLSRTNSQSAVGLSYEIVNFETRFDTPWQFVRLFYEKKTSLGPVQLHLNYANRFEMNGLQASLESYPRLGKKTYAYLAAGIATDNGVFPQFRGALSVFQQLPAKFELDGGVRILTFEETTWTYTAGIAKYLPNLFLRFSAFITPEKQDLAPAFNLTSRYYLNEATHFLELQAGTGVNPDSNVNGVLTQQDERLTASSLFLSYQLPLKKLWYLKVGGGIENIEYTETESGKQYRFQVSAIKRW